MGRAGDLSQRQKQTEAGYGGRTVILSEGGFPPTGLVGAVRRAYAAIGRRLPTAAVLDQFEGGWRLTVVNEGAPIAMSWKSLVRRLSGSVRQIQTDATVRSRGPDQVSGCPCKGSIAQRSDGGSDHKGMDRP